MRAGDAALPALYAIVTLRDPLLRILRCWCYRIYRSVRYTPLPLRAHCYARLCDPFVAPAALRLQITRTVRSALRNTRMPFAPAVRSLRSVVGFAGFYVPTPHDRCRLRCLPAVLRSLRSPFAAFAHVWSFPYTFTPIVCFCARLPQFGYAPLIPRIVGLPHAARFTHTRRYFCRTFYDCYHCWIATAHRLPFYRSLDRCVYAVAALLRLQIVCRTGCRLHVRRSVAVLPFLFCSLPFVPLLPRISRCTTCRWLYAIMIAVYAFPRSF